MQRLIDKIFQLHQKYRLERLNKMITNRGVLHPEANIENLSKDPSRIVVGKNTHVKGKLLVFKFGGKIEIGENCFIGEGCQIWSAENISIADDVLISHNVNIIDTDSHEM